MIPVLEAHSVYAAIMHSNLVSFIYGKHFEFAVVLRVDFDVNIENK
jgi:hypothetical protein